VAARVSTRVVARTVTLSEWHGARPDADLRPCGGRAQAGYPRFREVKSSLSKELFTNVVVGRELLLAIEGSGVSDGVRQVM
jgi:hypothetical protein